MSRMKAENTAHLMTEWAQVIVRDDATPVLCVSLNDIGKSSMFVNRDIDEAKIVILLRTIANKFEEQVSKERSGE